MSEQMIYCTACGNQFDKNAEMCPHCGKKQYNIMSAFRILNKYSSIINLLTLIFVIIIFIIIIQW
jgi:predicted amidophosphoribosyltransferase